MRPLVRGGARRGRARSRCLCWPAPAGAIEQRLMSMHCSLRRGAISRPEVHNSSVCLARKQTNTGRPSFIIMGVVQLSLGGGQVSRRVESGRVESSRGSRSCCGRRSRSRSNTCGPSGEMPPDTCLQCARNDPLCVLALPAAPSLSTWRRSESLFADQARQLDLFRVRSRSSNRSTRGVRRDSFRTSSHLARLGDKWLSFAPSLAPALLANDETQCSNRCADRQIGLER